MLIVASPEGDLRFFELGSATPRCAMSLLGACCSTMVLIKKEGVCYPTVYLIHGDIFVQKERRKREMLGSRTYPSCAAARPRARLLCCQVEWKFKQFLFLFIVASPHEGSTLWSKWTYFWQRERCALRYETHNSICIAGLTS